jgi:hypothetical protein
MGMSSDIFQRILEEKKVQDPFEAAQKKREEKKEKKQIGELEKLAVTLPAELFGGAIGAIPQLAKSQAEFEPLEEELEKQARPSYLSSTGLEPAPEKGIRNLLSLIGKKEGIEKYTPESLRKKFEETTEEKFKPESKLGKSLQHGVSVAGQALPFGVTGLSNLIGIGLGGAGGEALRQEGLPEKFAFAVETLSPAAIASLGKKFNFTPEEQALANLGKEIGFNDKQIAAVLKSPRSQKTFAKLASKGEKSENLISQMFENMGENYGQLKGEGRKIPASGKVATDLVDKWENILHDLEQTHKPSPEKASAIEYIKDVIQDVSNKGTNVEKLINQYQDINRSVNWNAWSGGKKQLAALKAPIEKAIFQTNKDVGNKFNQLNKLYKRSITLAKNFKPTTIDEILGHGKAGQLAFGIATVNPRLLGKVGAFIGAKKGAEKILFSPRFNKIQRKMFTALKNNQGHIVNQALQEWADLVDQEPLRYTEAQ